MLQRRPDAGWIISAVAHGALLAALVVALPQARKFTDAQESVPVEILTQEQFNQVVKGERETKKQNQDERADKVAAIPDSNPLPPLAEAKKNVPTPPPPLKKQIDPGEEDDPKPANPPKAAALPPPRPETEPEPERDAPPPPLPPVRPPLPKPAANPAKENKIAEPPRPVARDASIPLPPVRPRIEPKAEPKSEPKKVAAVEPDKTDIEPPEKELPPVPMPPQRPRDLPRVTQKKPVKTAKLQPDRIAKLLADKNKTDTAPRRPKSGDDSDQPRQLFDRSAIERLLSKEKAERRASSGQRIQPQARLGSQTASAKKMSPTLAGELDGLLLEQYRSCWNNLGLASGRRYIPLIAVSFTAAGRLAAAPRLLNPPGDPESQALADSAMRAVRKCDPLRIPAKFIPYHNEWKRKNLRFNPEDMMG